MEFYNKYPYTDFHEMNLDWLIHQVKATDKKVDDFTALNKLTWAGDWNIGNAYEQWSLVNDLEGNGYVAIVPVPRNVQITNTDFWKPVAKYDVLYGAFEARIAALENKNLKIEADIQDNADNIALNTAQIVNNTTNIENNTTIIDSLKSSKSTIIEGNGWTVIKFDNGLAIAGGGAVLQTVHNFNPYGALYASVELVTPTPYPTGTFASVPACTYSINAGYAGMLLTGEPGTKDNAPQLGVVSVVPVTQPVKSEISIIAFGRWK